MYTHAILGGTFDRFHLGHRKLIDSALEQSGRITIGLATEKIYNNKFLSNIIEPFSIREKVLKEYLANHHSARSISIIPLNDIYGTTLSDKTIEAIFVTKATAPNALKINEERKKLGFAQLKIIKVPFVKGKDGKIIKSERIRFGEIDRSGQVYMQIFGNKETLRLPQNLRQEMRNPLGNIFTKQNELVPYLKDIFLLISIGDVTSLFLKNAGYHPDISIIDFKTRRHIISREEMSSLIPLDSNPEEYFNKAGTINKNAVHVFRKAVEDCINAHIKQTFVIKGEEDLLTLPAILLAPLQSVVFYGQFDQGIVAVPVTEEKKKEVLQILRRFK